eukprot:1177301-Prorocentrum_minimum.AAC.3
MPRLLIWRPPLAPSSEWRRFISLVLICGRAPRCGWRRCRERTDSRWTRADLLYRQRLLYRPAVRGPLRLRPLRPDEDVRPAGSMSSQSLSHSVVGCSQSLSRQSQPTHSLSSTNTNYYYYYYELPPVLKLTLRHSRGA